MFKIVVVEDEKRVREGIILGTDWQSLNAVVVGEAGNGIDGLEAIRKYKPDVVITDIKMPRMTGLEMIKKVREEGLTPAVILLTAYGEFSYAQTAIRLNASEYLLKPFKEGELEAAVASTLKKFKRNAEAEDTTEEPEKPEPFEKGSKSKYIMKAIEYIEKNYASEEISVRSAAEALGISEGHLSHLFRKETDFTFMSYVTQCRMRAAMNLLKDYSHKVYEVAQMVGYRDITYFSALFKKTVGQSPSEYQDTHRE